VMCRSQLDVASGGGRLRLAAVAKTDETGRTTILRRRRTPVRVASRADSPAWQWLLTGSVRHTPVISTPLTTHQPHSHKTHNRHSSTTKYSHSRAPKQLPFKGKYRNHNSTSVAGESSVRGVESNSGIGRRESSWQRQNSCRDKEVTN